MLCNESCGNEAQHCTRQGARLCGKCYRRIKAAEWRAKHPEKAIETVKRYRSNHPEKRAKSKKNWVKNNKSKAAALAKRARDKRRSTPTGALNHRMEVSVRHYLGIAKDGASWEKLVGYSASDLQRHLQDNFLPGMSWDAFLRGAIHIDHIRPVATYDFKSPNDPEFKLCWALDNLRPLWALHNLRKNDKIICDSCGDLKSRRKKNEVHVCPRNKAAKSDIQPGGG